MFAGPDVVPRFVGQNARMSRCRCRRNSNFFPISWTALTIILCVVSLSLSTSDACDLPGCIRQERFLSRLKKRISFYMEEENNGCTRRFYMSSVFKLETVSSLIVKLSYAILRYVYPRYGCSFFALSVLLLLIVAHYDK